MATSFRFHASGMSAALPINLLGQATRWLSRAEQKDLIERLIAHIDSLDPDPELEPNGDELDGSLAEDDWCRHRSDGVARCPVADPPEDDDSDCCLAGDDRVFAGPVIYADALGFSSRPSRYAVGMDEN